MALLGAALLCATPASAQDACAKYEDAFAYNQCLATQGPKAHASRAVDAPAAAVGTQGGGRVHSALQVSRLRNGRMFAEFTISPSRAAPRKRAKPPGEP